jgi:hypothetical protein
MSGCDASTVGKDARGDYTDDYYFWKATGPGAPLIGRIDLSSGRSRTIWERPFPVTERGEIGPARSRYRT